MADLSQHSSGPNLPKGGRGKPGIREDVTRALLGASEKDCNDSRNRFVPRGALRSVITIECAERVLQAAMEQYVEGQWVEDAARLQEMARGISPRTGDCFCGYGHCTGGRMILATLLLCGREDLILTFFSLSNPRFCDQNLPLSFDSLHRIGHDLSTKEKEIFLHMQWQVYTPFLIDFRSFIGKSFAAFPEEVSLPWRNKERIGYRLPGEVSYVEKVEIYPCSHNLTSDNAQVFALKTFEQMLAPGLSKKRFQQEVEANLHAPEHDRIVRLLTAFIYRERSYLLFPYANNGNLETLWTSYAPYGVAQESPEVANWYTDNWLVGECLGISGALAAIHGFVDDRSNQITGLLHADIKPENILCFRDRDSATPPILKLADFGECRVIEPNGQLKASKVAHVLTYRPPEHSPNSQITLKYDVWCLGCVFLEFITWAISGHDGVHCFSTDREDEQDDSAVTEYPGQLIEDTFFRLDRASLLSTSTILRSGYSKKMKAENGRVKRTYSLWASSHVKITSRLKDGVVSHMKFLEQHDRCSDHLRQILRFVGQKMLVVDPEQRANSLEVRDFLSNLWSCS